MSKHTKQPNHVAIIDDGDDDDDDDTAPTEEISAELRNNQQKNPRTLIRRRRVNILSYPTQEEASDFFVFPCSTRELVEQKKKFLIFLRILLKYLLRTDQERHASVKAVLKDFAASFAGRSDPFTVPTQKCTLLGMYHQVKNLVTETQWNYSFHVLCTFLTQCRCRARSAGNSRTDLRVVISADGS
ncbi:hypothetical protein ACA910_017362 [Epithemia clementina (nom. ined.)]